MIRVENLVKKFGKLEVLKGINASFKSGQVISVIGPNGSGKTTLIKCILGMVIADKGKVFFDGKDISGDFRYRKDIGYMPQIGRYPENMKMGHLFSMMKDIRKENSLDEDLIREYASSGNGWQSNAHIVGRDNTKGKRCTCFSF